jgi:hypothetical protein
MILESRRAPAQGLSNAASSSAHVGVSKQHGKTALSRIFYAAPQLTASEAVQRSGGKTAEFRINDPRRHCLRFRYYVGFQAYPTFYALYAP